MHNTITVGAYEVNCTILSRNDSSVWIVDPGAESDKILKAVNGRKISGLLLTHGHFDHIGGIPALQSRFSDLPVYVSNADAKILTHPMNACPPEYPAINLPRSIRDCHELDWLTVIDTPGHTPGGVCYYLPEDKLLLSGDTLFAGSAGRTDFPGGNMAAMRQSLSRLKELPDETRVIPGHGPFTTIGFEKTSNPFLLMP